MNDMPENRHLRFLLRLFYLLFGIAVFYICYKYLVPWLLPFLISFVVACIIQKPVRALRDKLHIPHKLACILMVFFTYGVVGAAAFGVIYWFISELTGFISTLPALLAEVPNKLEAAYANLSQYLTRFSFIRLDGSASMGSLLEKLSGSLLNLSALFGTVKDVAFSIPNVLIFIIALFVGAYYFTSDFDNIRAFILAQFPDKVRESTHRLIEHLLHTLGRWCKAVGIMMLITFVELLIGFLLMKLDYASILAVLVAIVDALPVFGVGTVLIPWAVYCLITGAFLRALYLTLLYIVIVIVRNALEPKIVGHHIGLNPLLMLICLYLGYVTLGFIGMFVLPVLLIAVERLQAWGYIHVFNMPPAMQAVEAEDIPDPVQTLRRDFFKRFRKKDKQTQDPDKPKEEKQEDENKE